VAAFLDEVGGWRVGWRACGQIATPTPKHALAEATTGGEAAPIIDWRLHNDPG
jgi:hypothetical protein